MTENYRDDPDYIEGKLRRLALATELASLTSTIDNNHLLYVRDHIHTPRIERAELIARRSAARLEIALLTDAMAIIKNNYASKRKLAEA